jgi:hypothetical protein
MKTYGGVEILVHAFKTLASFTLVEKALMPIAWKVGKSPELLWLLWRRHMNLLL